MAKCICDCGKEVLTSKADVISGHTQSCGCLQSENTSKANEKDFSNYKSESGVLIKERNYKDKRGVWYWKCICPICGNEFSALPAKVISNHTTSCGCRIQSSRARIIEDYLIKISANYKKEVRFKDCKNKYTLPFDFAIYDNNNNLMFLIEYDREQHYKPVDFLVERMRLKTLKNETK